MLETNLQTQDLRQWLQMMEAVGDLKRVHGAGREDEIGGIVDIYQRKMGRPALLFDDVPGYPAGFRVLANLFVSVKRIAMTLGLPPEHVGDRTGAVLARVFQDRRPLSRRPRWRRVR